MADIYIEYLPKTGNDEFDLKAHQLIDLLRTILTQFDNKWDSLETDITWQDLIDI